MARIRTIKPEFWKNEALSELPEATHILAAALLNYADDFGYFNANPRLVESECSPLREPSVSIPESLRSLQTIGYIRLGTGDDGKRYGQVIEFATHQRVSHPSPSKIAEKSIVWDDIASLPEKFAKPPETFRPEQGTGNREQGIEQGKDNCAELLTRSTQDVVAMISLPTNRKGEEFPITHEQIIEFTELYPAVDVLQSLRSMRGWLIANPTKRKTKTGMLRFATSWLSKQQDQGRPNGQARKTTAHDNHIAGTALYLASLNLDSDSRGEGQAGADADAARFPLLAS